MLTIQSFVYTFGIFVSKMKISFVALVILFFIIFIILKISLKRKLVLFLIASILVIFAIPIFYNFQPGYLNKIKFYLNNPINNPSNQNRINNISMALDKLHENVSNIFLGVGVGEISYTDNVKTPDNMYIAFLVSFGYIGFMLIMILFIIHFIKLFFNLFYSKTNYRLNAFSIVVFSIILVFGLTSNILNQFIISSIFYFNLGIISRSVIINYTVFSRT